MSRRLRRVTRLGFLLAGTNLILWFGSPSIRSMIDTFYERRDHPDRPEIITGIQESWVYMDRWYSWWVMPAVFIVGFALVPLLFKPKPVKDADASGQSTIGFYAKLTPAILIALELVYLYLLYFGVARRGPKWALYGIAEKWEPKEVVGDNVNLSSYFWENLLGTELPASWVTCELPGIVLTVVYFAIGIAIARLLNRRHPTMSWLKWTCYTFVFQVAAILPIKMLLRWTVDLKYIIACPWFNL